MKPRVGELWTNRWGDHRILRVIAVYRATHGPWVFLINPRTRRVSIIQERRLFERFTCTQGVPARRRTKKPKRRAKKDRVVCRRWALGPTSDVYRGTKPPGPGWKPLTADRIARWAKARKRRNRR